MAAELEHVTSSYSDLSVMQIENNSMVVAIEADVSLISQKFRRLESTLAHLRKCSILYKVSRDIGYEKR